MNTAINQAFANKLDRMGLRGSGAAPQPLGTLGTPGIQTITNVERHNTGRLCQPAGGNPSDPPGRRAGAAGCDHVAPLPHQVGRPDRHHRPADREAIDAGKLEAHLHQQVPNNLTVGTSSDCSEIYVGHFSKVQFMMREQMSILVARELFAETGEIGFICHVQADVALMYPKAIAVVTGVRQPIRCAWPRARYTAAAFRMWIA